MRVHAFRRAETGFSATAKGQKLAFERSAGGRMLTMTVAASSAVTTMRDERGLPEDFGLRLYTASADDGKQSIRMDFAASPRDGDEVAEADGARIFIAPELADALDGRVLDATEEGSSMRLLLQ